MKLDYFHTVMLYCLEQFNGERTVSAIYHLLNGKKSSQTIQDGKLFNVTFLFSLFPKLSRIQSDETWNALLKQGLIEQLPDNKCKLTIEGKEFLKESIGNKPIPEQLNGWNYGDIGRVFWRRLSLLVQVLSNYTYEKKDYLPVTKNQEDLQWVKIFLKQQDRSNNELTNCLYKELKDILNTQLSKDATIFVQRLTSSQKIGLTFEQIAYKHDEDSIYTYLLFWNVVHSIIQSLQTNKDKYLLLNEIIQDKWHIEGFTSSTKITRSYLLQGLDPAEIATVRRLKQSTIEDHIVEITLHDQQYIPTPFLNEEDYNKIMGAITKLKTHQLKKVREFLNNEYSYFQIRLTYALIGRGETSKV
ncbi:helix-turn-helix domain-containing protein [Metabacillus sp. B2-18]|uniref:helix-turn-helix domain-containing protein n=1 Tax=Metabacillus sp. B2-18 TaxID=2897333 RepID=UPI001E5FD98B|nr:helix-turn-helix domain-containing protein [Metabacillus sp. B2-18]UGB29301.1 helix-turn-helix domain-containing protein [Metabacillus sp. B2-18]